MNVDKHHNRYFKSLIQLDNWRKKNGWNGHDPYGIGDKVFSLFGKTKFALIFNKILNLFGNKWGFIYSSLFHKLFKIKTYDDPKTYTYFGQGYLLLYQITKNKNYLDLAAECADWLVKNTIDKKYACWGHPFIWYTSTNNYFHKKNNPNLYISSLAAHFLLDIFEILKNKKYQETAINTGNFILRLPYFRENNKKICFWYIPDKKELPVHNGNIYTASLLLYLARTTKEFRSCSDLALQAINYHLAHQNQNGSWYYFGPPLSSQMKNVIDNSHTAFNLNALKICYNLTNLDSIKNGILKGANYYSQNLFNPDGSAKPTPGSLYPQCIHDMAHGIYAFSSLADFDKKYLATALKIADYAIKNMQDKEGHFYHLINKKQKIRKFPYMRYNQAPMFRALAMLLYQLSKTKNKL